MKLIYVLLIGWILAGCIREDLEPCPQSEVRIKLYVEKFQAAPGASFASAEPHFNDRIDLLRYYLYKEGVVIEQGLLPDCRACTDSAYVFRRKGLEFGDYKLVLIGNDGNGALTPDPDDLIVVYQGVDQTKDLFTACLPFTVNCTCELHFQGLLERMHGVVRSSFEQLPPDVTALEVKLTNVGTRKPIEGAYEGCEEVTKRVDLTGHDRAKQVRMVMGVFPSAGNRPSAYYLSLYKRGQDTPAYQSLVTDTLTVVRNQLIEIKTHFGQTGPSFEVHVDTKWEGSLPAGGVEVN